MPTSVRLKAPRTAIPLGSFLEESPNRDSTPLHSSSRRLAPHLKSPNTSQPPAPAMSHLQRGEVSVTYSASCMQRYHGADNQKIGKRVY